MIGSCSAKEQRVNSIVEEGDYSHPDVLQSMETTGIILGAPCLFSQNAVSLGNTRKT